MAGLFFKSRVVYAFWTRRFLLWKTNRRYNFYVKLLLSQSGLQKHTSCWNKTLWVRTGQKKCAVLCLSGHFKATDKATVSRRRCASVAKWTSLLKVVYSTGTKTAHSGYTEKCHSNKQRLHTTMNVETAYQAEELIPDHLVQLCLAHCPHAEPETKGPVLGPVWCWERERERERQRQRQRQRQRDRPTETETERDTDRQTDWLWHAERPRETENQRQRERGGGYR